MRIIEIFKQITAIPRCSGTYKPFIEYMQNIAKRYNYLCHVDGANNILLYKNNSNTNICLQSHYDIVCLKNGKIPKIIESNGFLKAKDSTLGADNGIGCAYMLYLIENSINCEYLFTSDEEIGLVGANNIEFNIQSSYMLNLDSEVESEICIGCAGGVDIFATNNKSSIMPNSYNKTLFKIQVDKLDGGHSGIDIDKNIPNALKLIAQSIKECDGELISLEGGDRINSIPKSAKAIILSEKTPLQTTKNMTIQKIDKKVEHYKKLDGNIINFLYTFSNGTRGYDSKLDVVTDSINLAIAKNINDGVHIQLSARSMDDSQLEIIKNETTSLLQCFGFEVSYKGKYPAWQSSNSPFTQQVLQIYKKYNKNARLRAIHAGLECAIFQKKFPHMQICSIGPNIYFPHSIREKCEVTSVNNVYEVIKDIVVVTNRL
ncbi:Aminoacyl-histidine dipeptidase (Peptidase D) [hydrothermal vent metagenome]|uniref:Aminoacyl-histidine dipeptidase (Peptidase D) n=1 Tax=hydrothermal vent metagenome TaxID=652676 RepID=A0A3B1DS25_9ZZZZ